MRSMKNEHSLSIVHVSPMYHPAVGGAELHLKEVSEGLVARGHQVTVLTADVKDSWAIVFNQRGGLPTRELVKGVKVVRFDPRGGVLGAMLRASMTVRGGYRILSAILSNDEMAYLLRGPQLFSMIPHILSSKPDIVASMNWYWPPAYHAYLARKLKRFTLVGIPLFHTARPWVDHAVYRRMLAQCDAVVTNTEHEAEFVQQRARTRAEVAGVGVHPEQFLSRDGSHIRTRYSLGHHPVIGFVGRQIGTKGIVKLIEAMRSVWKWNPDVRLAIAGPQAKLNDEVESLIKSLNEREAARVVRINEFRDEDKASLYDAFDVFALPSTEDSFGISYLESWMCRKPVVGGRIPSTQCVIDEGIDGLTADPYDAEDIAAKIIELLSDRDKRETMGRNGYNKTVSRFTWEKVTDKMESLYRELSALTSSRRITTQPRPMTPQAR
jgi:glycosyltransferase involved in cell wall biosynthesis